MGRCLIRSKYRLSRLNRVEFMVLISCAACVSLIVYAVSLHQENRDLLVLQDSNTIKEPAQPNAKRSRRSINDFSDQSNAKESVEDKQDYDFMELKDFDTDYEKAGDTNINQNHPNNLPFLQENRHIKVDIVQDDNNRETKEEFHFDARDSEILKEENGRKRVGSKVYPLPNNNDGRIDIYEKSLGKDEINLPILQKRETNVYENVQEKNDAGKSQSQVNNIKYENFNKGLIQKEYDIAHAKENSAKISKNLPNIIFNQRKLYVQATGGLGTKLFQYASLVGVAKQTDRHAVITPDSDIMYSFQKLSAETGYIPSSADIAQTHETSSAIFSPHLFSLPIKDTLLCCYLQSWRYFQIYEDQIRTDFIFSESINMKAKAALRRAHLHHYKKISRTSDTKDSVSYTYIGIHVRRSGYTKSMEAQGYVTAPISYILKAMAYFRNKFNNALFIVCSDDIKWCKNNINGSDVEFVSTGEPVVDLSLLTHCEHTIITVGALGWWAGWLTGGEVVYYNDWPKTGSELASHFHKKDYFLTTWLPMGD